MHCEPCRERHHGASLMDLVSLWKYEEPSHPAPEHQALPTLDHSGKEWKPSPPDSCSVASEIPAATTTPAITPKLGPRVAFSTKRRRGDHLNVLGHS